MLDSFPLYETRSVGMRDMCVRDNPVVEFNQLKAFLAVARTGQLARAADQLHVTQSALSKQVKGLEDELGVLLFSRTVAGMALTAAGQKLLAPISRTLDGANEIKTLARAMQGSVTGELRLGTIIDPESIRLGPLLAALVRTHPQLGVSLVHGVSGGLLRQVRDGSLDACFHLGTVTDPEVAGLELSLEHYLVVGPTSWKDRLQSANWSDLATMPWLATPEESSQHGLVDRMFAERGLAYQTVVEADQEASMIELVKTGVALGLIRERIAAPAVQAGSVVVWPGARLPCPLTMLYLRSNAGAPSLQALFDALRSIWNSAAR